MNGYFFFWLDHGIFWVLLGWFSVGQPNGYGDFLLKIFCWRPYSVWYLLTFWNLLCEEFSEEKLVKCFRFSIDAEWVFNYYLRLRRIFCRKHVRYWSFWWIKFWILLVKLRVNSGLARELFLWIRPNDFMLKFLSVDVLV